jgi:hypothetical protein
MQRHGHVPGTQEVIRRHAQFLVGRRHVRSYARRTKLFAGAFGRRGASRPVRVTTASGRKQPLVLQCAQEVALQQSTQ